MNEKQTNSAGTMSKLLSFANDCRGKLIGSMLLAILGVLCGMVPYFCAAIKFFFRCAARKEGYIIRPNHIGVLDPFHT